MADPKPVTLRFLGFGDGHDRDYRRPDMRAPLAKGKTHDFPKTTADKIMEDHPKAFEIVK